MAGATLSESLPLAEVVGNAENSMIGIPLRATQKPAADNDTTFPKSRLK